jgi:AcrR family transcriptional regulator
MSTRAAILDSAHAVFKETGYYGSSILEITRRCGVSAGTFYQYFKNKEQVFVALSELIVSRFLARVDSPHLTGPEFGERLRSALRLLCDHARENFAFHRILGESELIDRVTIGYYESMARFLCEFLRREARSGNIRPLDPEMVAYALIGISYFHSLDWRAGSDGLSTRRLADLIAELILNGIGGPTPWRQKSRAHSLSIPPPALLRMGDQEPLTKGERTRQAILQAAERVFAQRGVNRANVAEITRDAGVAQGTFYVHFASKWDLTEGFVKYINQKMRREIQRVVTRTRDRRDAERVGALAFFEFIRQHREIYRVVPEFEMIGREVGLWYYEKMAQGYVQGLRTGMEKGQIRDFPPVFLARSLMGATHFIGLRWIIWNPDPQAGIPDRILRDLLELLFFGLKPG